MSKTTKSRLDAIEAKLAEQNAGNAFDDAVSNILIEWAENFDPRMFLWENRRVYFLPSIESGLPTPIYLSHLEACL